LEANIFVVLKAFGCDFFVKEVLTTLTIPSFVKFEANDVAVLKFPFASTKILGIQQSCFDAQMN
jgi:hypothetical protein